MKRPSSYALSSPGRKRGFLEATMQRSFRSLPKIRPIEWVLILLAVFIAMQARAEDSPDFSRYESSAGVRFFAREHLSGKFHSALFVKPDKGTDSPPPLLLALSFIDRNGGAAWNFFLTKPGHLVYCVDVFDWAVQGGMEAQLDEQKMATIKEQISALPKANSYPDIGSLVIVSFQDGDKWITRTCQPADVQGLRKCVEAYVRIPRPASP